MKEWHQGTVVANTRAAAGLHAVHVDVSGTPLVGTHSLPGQYLTLKIEELGEGLFAIASGPEADGHTFELLVKEGSPVSDALIAAKPGLKVWLTAPEGRGFPVERARGRRVLLFATGSGISAIRSLIQVMLKDRSAWGEVTLYFGARTPGAFAYAPEFDRWRAHGIKVVLTVSQRAAPGWRGLTGYVQAHLPEERLHDAVAFVCGQEQMVEDVRRVLRARGMPDENIFQNV
ncbi:MAG: NAD-binding oxidoreductase [Myxococcaceae bacterium]|nr:NAD-binding oxidoreductase [Myxococcaceae bacterium]